MSALGSHRTRWSPAEVERLESMLSEQADLTEIALQLGRTEKAVEAKAYSIKRQRNGRKAGKHHQRRLSGASFFLS
jgi:hypothetical protein